MSGGAADGTAPGGLSYRDAGVDIAAGNRLVEIISAHTRRTRRPGADGAIGGFGGIFDLAAAGYRDPLLVAATDGVGTKLELAISAGRIRGVGIDLVAMCVNDLVVQGAEPLLFLDYYATGRLEPEAAAEVVAGIADGCVMAGAALVGGETAEMPGFYPPGRFDLAGFAVGAVERDRLLPRTDVAPGDVLLGLASSGVHSNGYSLVRAILARSGAAPSGPPPFRSEAASLAEALLAPTRIYVRPLLDVHRNRPEALKALAHITGGGLTENVPRVLPADVAALIDLARVPFPPVFGWLRAEGGVAEAEMLRTFNCGIGMVAVVPPDRSDAVAADLSAAGETVVRLGEIVPRTGGAVEYRGGLPA